MEQERRTFKFIGLVMPGIIIFLNISIFHKTLHWSSILALIIIELFVYSFIVGCVIKLVEKYREWRENRNRTRPERIVCSFEQNIGKKQILNLKDECIICLEPLDGAIELKCSHIYHRHCIDQMMEYKIITCPLCRADMA